jgi:hypothetical protein
MRRKGQQDCGQGQHANAGDGPKQHPADNAAEKYQDPQGIAEQRNGPSDEVTEWIHLKL